MDPKVLILSFSAGLAIFFSPCSVALLPGYVGFFVAQQEKKESHFKKALLGIKLGTYVSLGLLSVFFVVGGLISIFGNFIAPFAIWFGIVTGIALIILGILMFAGSSITISLPHSFKDRKKGFLKFYIFGIGYAIGSIACTLPVFLLVVFAALGTGSFFGGLINFLAFSAGAILLMIIVTTIAAVSKSVVSNWLNKHMKTIRSITALIVVLAGIYMIYFNFRAYQASASIPQEVESDVNEGINSNSSSEVTDEYNLSALLDADNPTEDSLAPKLPFAVAMPFSQRVTLAIGTIPIVDGSNSMPSTDDVPIEKYEWEILKAPDSSGFEEGQVVAQNAIWDFPKPQEKDIGQWRLKLTVTDEKDRSNSNEIEIFIHDKIELLTNPEHILASEVDLPLDEYVAGIIINQEAVAFPASVMNQHNIVNDVVGDEPIYLVMCQSCQTTAAFKRTKDDGKVITLQSTNGALIESNYEYPDIETGTRWLVAGGEAIEGIDKGKFLEPLPDEYLFFGTWEEWLAEYPISFVITNN